MVAMLLLEQKMRTGIVLRRISLPRDLFRGSSFQKTSYRLSSSQKHPHSSSSIHNSTSNDHLHNLHGHLKDSTRYVTGTFISSFADSLAFYLVTFSVIGVGSYFVYQYVSQTIKRPFQRSQEKLEEKKTQLLQKVKDMKDSANDTVTSMKETVVAGADAVKGKMKDSVEVFRRSKSTEGPSSEAPPSPVSDDNPQASPTEFLKAKAVTLKEKMSESFKSFGSQEEGQETAPPPKESLTERAASWGKGLFLNRNQRVKKESDSE